MVRLVLQYSLFNSSLFFCLNLGLTWLWTAATESQVRYGEVAFDARLPGIAFRL